MSDLRKFYAGIGSRETPMHVIEMMIATAKILSNSGWVLRSGGAKGADQAFQFGAKENCEIFVPWENFEGNPLTHPVSKEAVDLVKKFHPRYKALTKTGVSLMARNHMQVMGADLRHPSDFVLCWTKDGATHKTTKNTGGTGQAIRIAAHYGVPVYNLNMFGKGKEDVVLQNLKLDFGIEGL